MLIALNWIPILNFGIGYLILIILWKTSYINVRLIRLMLNNFILCRPTGAKFQEKSTSVQKCCQFFFILLIFVAWYWLFYEKTSYTYQRLSQLRWMLSNFIMCRLEQNFRKNPHLRRNAFIRTFKHEEIFLQTR